MICRLYNDRRCAADADKTQHGITIVWYPGTATLLLVLFGLIFKESLIYVVVESLKDVVLSSFPNGNSIQ